MPHTSDWYRQEETLVAELSRGGPGPGIAVAIPGYEDLCEISRGGQGIVYSALQRSTKRRVAVKVLLESALLFDSHRRRFEREIDLAAGLRHPHIVRVYDSGTISTGRQYYVMDLIEGKPLDAWLAEAGSRSIRDLLRRFSRICEAVHYAHQRGVIHRDLKPANILIDDRDEPHILDFGVAKPSGRSTGESGHVSVTGGSSARSPTHRPSRSHAIRRRWMSAPMCTLLG